MTAVVAKLDSKGRVTLPRGIREMIGDIVEIETVGSSSVILRRSRTRSRKTVNETKGFFKLVVNEPKRTDKPENPSPKDMKSIWNER